MADSGAQEERKGRDLSRAADALFASQPLPAVMQLIAVEAVAAMEGCDMAGVVALNDELMVPVAVSDPAVRELEELQARVGEGPWHDVVASGGPVYSTDVLTDDRWPRFGPAVAARGLRSVFACEVSTDRSGVLCLYSRFPAAFGVGDRARALLFATFARLALESAGERAHEEETAIDLRAALESRSVIGQAQGILMEREGVSADDAFQLLRRASQHLNVKLRDIAQHLVDTGETGEP